MQVSLLHKGCVASRIASRGGLVSYQRPLGYTKRCLRFYSSQNDDILGDNDDTFALVRFIEFLETSRNWSSYQQSKRTTGGSALL